MPKLYNANCIEILQSEIESSSIDLVVTDPPYLKDYQSNHRTATPKFDKIENDEDNGITRELLITYFNECYRVLKDNTAIYVFCDWATIDFFKTEFERLFKLKNILIWKKNNWSMGDLRGAYAHQYEMILFGHKGRRLLNNGRPRDVLEYARVVNDLHPTPKPIPLCEQLITDSSQVGDVVFDGFMGIGSTMIAAKYNRRDYIGVELKREYFNIAQDTINNSPVKLGLF